MTRAAYAKINLGLRILNRRADGYHNIETVFSRIGWCDRITLEPADHFSFACSDLSLPVDDSNLVVRAVHEFEAATGLVVTGHVTLEKVLPYGAGLGSGSSDAATMLELCAGSVGLNEQPDVDSDLLALVGARLGADIPFFLAGGVQFGEATGTQLTIVLDEAGAPYRLPFFVVVVSPDVFVSSALAYKGVVPRPRLTHEEVITDVIRSNDLEWWSRSLVNDFEPTVFAAFPQIRQIKYQLMDAGAGYASLSGSGSSVYGLFETADQAEKARDSIALHSPGGCRTWIGEGL